VFGILLLDCRISSLSIFIRLRAAQQPLSWTPPPEWNIREAWVKNAEGEKIIDFQVSNLHVMGYSTPVDKTMQFSELRGHLHSLPEQPDAIPYITSYYKERWGILPESRAAAQPFPRENTTFTSTAILARES